MPDSEITKLETRIRILESQVTFLLKVNGLEVSALRNASEEELLKYYRDSIQLLGLREKQLSPDVCLVWSELFCQLSEFELIRIHEIVGYPHTWEPFYTLCVRMMTAVRHARGFNRNGELQHLYAFLDKGRKNLRASAVVIVRRHPQGLPSSTRAILEDELVI